MEEKRTAYPLHSVVDGVALVTITAEDFAILSCLPTIRGAHSIIDAEFEVVQLDEELTFEVAQLEIKNPTSPENVS